MIIKYIQEKLIHINENPNFELNEEIYIDQLDLVWLVMEFEKDFDVSCDDNEVEKLKTFGDMIKFFTLCFREKKLERITKLF